MDREVTFNRDVIETPITARMLYSRTLYKNCIIFSRCFEAAVFFDSACHARNSAAPNSYVSYMDCGVKPYGQIQYFVAFSDSDLKFAFVKMFDVISEYLSDTPELRLTYFLQVEPATKTKIVDISIFEKLACIKTSTEIWLAVIRRFLDHK